MPSKGARCRCCQSSPLLALPAGPRPPDAVPSSLKQQQNEFLERSQHRSRLMPKQAYRPVEGLGG